jgi:two-component system OmpR family response regulator
MWAAGSNPVIYLGEREMKRKILVVDDDEKLLEILEIYLKKDGYSVITATDGVEALRLFREHRPDLIVLDLMLPRIKGEKVCSRIRMESDVPIIMLTAKTTERDKIAGLDTGADDYVTKPFGGGELLARIRANLRRKGEPEEPTVISQGELTVDVKAREVKVGGEPVGLTGTEFDLLMTLIRDPGTVLSRVQLIHGVFGYGYDGLERTIDTHINNLRKKIEPDPSRPKFVKTVFGVGYKFDRHNY